MLQRIQTLFIILALFSEVFLMMTSEDVLSFENIPLVKYVALFVALVISFSLISYKKRKLQRYLNGVACVINALLIGVLVYWLMNLSGGIHFPEKGIEPLFPFFGIVFLLLANGYIQKDEKLVKSVDRLR